MRKSSSITAGLLCSAVAAPAGFAQAITDDAAGTTVLAPIVVTASGFEQTVVDAPASITVVTSEELEKGSFTNLTDALREVQGVVTTGVAAEKDIQIRGLPGQYTLILVDGKRQSTRDARPNGSAGYEQSFIPPISAIERIEVVRGPMSSLYGSDAMGGVINIITKKVGDTWSGSVSAETTVNDNSDFGNSEQLSFYMNGPVVRDRLGLQVWGRLYNRDQTDIENAANGSEEYDLTGRLTYTPNANHDIALEMGTSRVHAERYDDLNETDYDRKHWSLSHTGRFGQTTTELSFQQELGERKPYTRTTTDTSFVATERTPEILNSTLDAKLTTPLSFGGDHMLVAGGQWFDAQLTDQNPGSGSTADQEFSATQWALFAEDEWHVTEDFALTTGLRYNDHESYGGHVTPRLYGVWTVSPDLTLKGGVSTGFRAPDIRQTVDGYYLTTQGGRGVIFGDPSLEPEESTSFELAALWSNGSLSLGATAFKTDFENKIESYNTGETVVVEGTTYNRWVYENVQDAVIKGVELTADYEITGSLNLRGSYTYTKSEQKSGTYEGLPLARTPEHMASLRLDWETPVQGLDAWSAVNYHGSEINAGARVGTNGRPVVIDGVTGYKYKAYTTMDIGGGYQVSETAKINAAIYNIFNEELNENDYNVVQEGRRFWVGVTTNF